jgi:hypothetical protein
MVYTPLSLKILLNLKKILFNLFMDQTKVDWKHIVLATIINKTLLAPIERYRIIR